MYFKLVSHNQIILLFDVSISIRGLRQKKLVLVLQVLDTLGTCRVKKAVIFTRWIKEAVHSDIRKEGNKP